MIIVSRYTSNGKYPALAQKLISSCAKFSLPYDIQLVPDLGSFQKNISQKPSWIIDALITHRKPIIWLDCDSEIISYPELFDTPNIDFACLNWHDLIWKGNEHSYDPRTLKASGGTLYFNYTTKTLELLFHWKIALEEHPEEIEDEVLSQVFNRTTLDLKTLWLPRSYNCFFEDVVPVIRHDYVNRSHGNELGFHLMKAIGD